MTFWFPESTGGGASTSSTVVTIEMSTDVRSFFYYNLVRDIASSQMFMVGNVDEFEALQNGWIRATSCVVPNNLTAGIISIVPTIAGAPIANTNLNLTLNVGNPKRHRRNVAQLADFAFSQGDLLGFEITTNSVLTPQNEEIQAIMWVDYST